MDKKLITYVIPVIIGLILLGGILYFISFFREGGDKMSTSLDEFKGKTEIFSSKKEAYDAYIRDSVVKVRDENVSVSLNDLFTGKKEEAKELIPENRVSGMNVETPAMEPVKETPRKREYTTSHGATPRKREPANFAASTPVNTSKEMPEQKPQRRESFNSFSQQKEPQGPGSKAILIRAVIHSKQTVYSGATVKLRSTAPFSLNGIAIPENTLIYGVTSIINERVVIAVNSINFNGSILPVSLRAFDRDGMEGIYIPGLVEQDIRSESVDNAITELQTELNVPRIASGAANVLRSRNKATTAILTDNYEITLK